MELIIKNLQQKSFKVTIDPSSTVLQLKEAIQKQEGSEYPVDLQKLIYAGKILEDDAIVKDCNIDVTKFVVIMVVKSKVDSENTASSSSSTSSKESTKPAKSEKKEETDSKSSAVSDSVASAESEYSAGTNFESMVNDIINMGFTRLEVETALRASYNNRARAVEYLLNGLPENYTESLDSENISSVAVPPSESRDTLAFLRDLPQFQQMRNLVQQNPEFLNDLLQQIGQTNPDLLRIISNNQEAFVSMLNEPVSGGNSAADRTTTGGSTGESGAGSLSSASEEVGASGTVATITLTAQDKQAINELKALGFSEEMAVQAYVACDKNLESAANFLLSQNLDD